MVFFLVIKFYALPPRPRPLPTPPPAPRPGPLAPPPDLPTPPDSPYRWVGFIIGIFLLIIILIISVSIISVSYEMAGNLADSNCMIQLGGILNLIAK
jgi:hypothetical protein